MNNADVVVPVAPMRLGLSWPVLIGAAAFLLLMGRPELLNDGDVYWHVRAGQWILEHGAVPGSDVFSHTQYGASWAAHEWLAEVLFAIVFAWAGWTGLVILAVSAFAATLAILSRFLLRYLEPLYMLLFVVLSASLLASHLFARPHALIAPLLLAWSIGLVRAQEDDRSPSWWLVAIMPFWANLHGSFVFGLALAVPFFFDAVVKAARHRIPWQTVKTWVAFLVLAGIASMLTPFGLNGLLFAFEVDQMRFALKYIVEWQPANFQRLQPLEVALLLTAAAFMYRGMRLPLLRLIILLGLVHMALRHVRHADLLAVVGPVLLAQPFATQWSNTSDRPRSTSTLDRIFVSLAPRASIAATSIVVLVLAAIGYRAIDADALRPAAKATPEAALQAVQRNHISGPVFNAYEFGGYLIHAGVPTFIDGRTDLYAESLLPEFMAAVNVTSAEALPTLLEKHGVEWTLLQPWQPAVAVLDRLPGWRRLHADKVAVVHVREQ